MKRTRTEPITMKLLRYLKTLAIACLAMLPVSGLADDLPAGFTNPPDTCKPGETFVFSVDQAVTGEPKSWTHRVAEAGDYQLGMAWVEVQSGEEVEVTIMAAGKVVKSLKAQPGLAPQRLETRLENLAAGDEITVKAAPKGASYRLGYQIAFGTPTFPDAEVFHVKDFGAVGDGETDDFAAIQKAVAAARESGCGIVRFDGSKTYRVIGKTDFTEESLFDLKGAKHLKIEGQGAKIVLHPPDSLRARGWGGEHPDRRLQDRLRSQAILPGHDPEDRRGGDDHRYRGAGALPGAGGREERVSRALLRTLLHSRRTRSAVGSWGQYLCRRSYPAGRRAPAADSPSGERTGQ